MSDTKKIVQFEGECLYACVYPSQARSAHPDSIKEGKAHAEDKSYSITVECSEDLYKQLRKAGISSMQALKDADNFPKVEGLGSKTFITIRGTHTKVYTDRKSGELVTTRFRDPVVTDIDGDTLDSNTLIGNGSKVIVKAELVSFPGKTLKALRLESVQVLDLVPYEAAGEKEEEVLLKETKGTTTRSTAADKATDNTPDMF